MKQIVVVLHKPIYPRNVGMCARAMGNMRGTRLVLVQPQCELNEEAKQGAVHAQDILRNARIYKDLREFQANEGEGLRIALSGRKGNLMLPDSLENVVDRIVLDPDHPIRDFSSPIYLMFGAEDDGMTNEEMELCHYVCRLPTFGDITSLNLSHAVLLTLYIVQRALRDGLKLDETSSRTPTEQVKAEPLYYPQETIKRWLEALGFDLSSKRVNIEKTLNRILLSHAPTAEELKIIDGVLQQTVRKLQSKRN